VRAAVYATGGGVRGNRPADAVSASQLDAT